MQKHLKRVSSRWVLLWIGTLVLGLLPVSHAAMAMDVDMDQHLAVQTSDQSVCNDSCANPEPCLEHCLQQTIHHKVEAISTSFESTYVSLLPVTAYARFDRRQTLYRKIFLRSHHVWRSKHLSTQARE
ncbi:hypothetical protein COV06_01380 [Candidatus Uhrbacteria bacterium CG10_big_fil_rev_8_21_14_0_10_50_16]|uniref:Uncharacterized protein n=1 Tax=Candidatus Uhrbacteria bacterium CG10_big_fil_rev_8_21_14_0_10_50_16 TaxID=1975039 RepID=A0A2H0RNB3_9BACT|nr:MAG: hypothetical protein COV06_01380 [Candidatus Uhrbacteria bacterium CG10_big_fil_rev_8_21_14_0_10_50_16]